jgi:hypothetical protein
MKRITSPVLAALVPGLLFAAPGQADPDRWQGSTWRRSKWVSNCSTAGSAAAIPCPATRAIRSNPCPPGDLSQVPAATGQGRSPREMINWCSMNPLESEPLALDAPDMVALAHGKH